jgi:pyrroline-5-carboxylate reductase
MKTSTIAIIGGGNMGASLTGGLLADGFLPEKIIITDPKPERLQQLAERFGIRTTTSNLEAVKEADVVILSIKPQSFAKAVNEVAAVIAHKKPLLISIAAGIRDVSIRRWLGEGSAIVRAMPNTPALIGCGATALFANANVSAEQCNAAETILRAIGVVVWVAKEELIDVVTGLSGSGPAYFFLMMEAMQAAGEDLGLPREVARLLTLQTAFGAASMALQSEETLQQLRQRVTSPKGTTEQGVRVLEEANIRHILKETVRAAKNRSEELARLFAATEN